PPRSSLSFPTRRSSDLYFCDQLHIEKTCLPVKLYMGGPTSQPSLRYFVDKFPLFFSSPRPGDSPVVTFSYVDPGLETLTGFVTQDRKSTRLNSSHQIIS